MAFSFAQQPQATSSLFQTQPQQTTPLFQTQQTQPSLFQTQPQQTASFSPFPQQQQQQTQPSTFQFPQQQQQQQMALPQGQPQSQQMFLFTNEKTPATYSTKWADLHPDSQKFLLQIEEKVLEYRDESQRLDQCSRLYDSSILNGGFELDASRILQEVGGIGTAMDRHKAICHELMAVVKDMLHNTEIAVRSFMMLRPRFLHSNAGAATPQTSGLQLAQSTANQPAASSMVPVFDFYSGMPRKPSLFFHQTVARFEKYIAECRQWIEELEQLILLNADRDSLNSTSSLLHSLPKVMENVHDFFVHVAAKVESIHQHIESMKTAYLADQRRRGDGNDPFLEADRRETAKQEAAERRVHPTLHLPAPSQPSTQVAGPFSSSSMTSAVTAQPTAASSASSGSSFSFLNTPSTSPLPATSLFSTPATSTTLSLFGSSGASPQSTLFGTLSATTPTQSTLFGTPSATTPTQSTLFGTLSATTPTLTGPSPLFGSTPASGGSSFQTPFATGASLGSGASFNTTSKTRGKPRSTRR